MQSYRIVDKKIIDLLIENGFTCKKAESNRNATISFHFQTQKEFEESVWYDTNCPIEFNGEYVLPDKTVIESSGTSLITK